jgi:hypothetical protein
MMVPARKIDQVLSLERLETSWLENHGFLGHVPVVQVSVQ